MNTAICFQPATSRWGADLLVDQAAMNVAITVVGYGDGAKLGI